MSDALLPQLPTGWVWLPMSEVCEKIQDGTHFSPENQQAEGRYPYVTAKNVRPWGLDLSDLTFLTEEDHREIYQRCDPVKGDVLLVKDGVNTGDAAVNTFDGEISLLSSVCMLRPKRGVLDSSFLRYFLLSPQGYRQLTGQMTGTAIKRIILRKIRDTPVPLAPASEQHRIVARIEELLPDLDAAVAALRRAKANLKRYRAAVLKAAVEGRLTAEWRKQHPATEPASKLLDRILAERRKRWEADQGAKFTVAEKPPPKGWREKYVEPTPPDTSGLPELPDGWCWATVDQLLIEPTCNGISVKGSDDPPGVPSLRLSAMGDDGFDYEQCRYIPITAYLADSLRVYDGDFFVSRGNGSLHLVGRGTLAKTPPELVVFPDTMIRVRLARIGCLAGFISLIWRSRLVRRQIEKKARTTAGIYKISQRDVESFVVPLPPLNEQEQILAEWEQRASLMSSAEGQIERDLLRSGRLRQSILKRAFEGKLVPQDPNDEPAIVLLERIKAERQKVSDNGEAPMTARRGRRAAR